MVNVHRQYLKLQPLYRRVTLPLPPSTNGIHSFLGCASGCADMIKLTAVVTGGQPVNGVTFNVTPLGPITDDPRNLSGGTSGTITFSGQSNRTITESACKPFINGWVPGDAHVCPSPELAYMVTAKEWSVAHLLLLHYRPANLCNKTQLILFGKSISILGMITSCPDVIKLTHLRIHFSTGAITNRRKV